MGGGVSEVERSWFGGLGTVKFGLEDGIVVGDDPGYPLLAA
jgi:hypothetical protein